MHLLYPISITSSLLGVSITTIRRWDKAGIIKCFRTPGGHRRFSLDEIRRVLLGKKRRERKARPSRALVYARVSSHDQKDDLVRQQEKLENYCKVQKLVLVSSHKDIGSGLNARRKGLLQVLKKISRGGISQLVINYRNRLTRFGFEYLEHFCQQFATEIVIISQDKKVERSMEQELVEDLVAIISSFSGRMHGMRSTKKRKKKLKVKKK